MTEDLKGLLDKIQQEGVEAAQKKAQDIQKAAQQKADALVAEAKKEAQRIINEAKQEIARNKDSAQATLKQAGRDLLLSLRMHIQGMLGKIVRDHIGQALKPEEMAHIIATIIKDISDTQQGTIEITVNKADVEKLQSFLAQQLKHALKKGIEIRPSENVRSGFRISYDEGKSAFDFSDEELAAYITTYIKPMLRDIFGSDKSKVTNAE